MRYVPSPSLRRFVVGVFLIPALISVVTILAAQAVNPPGAPADHFLSYKTKATKGAIKFAAIRNVQLADRFEDLHFDAVGAGDLLVPVAAAGDAPVDALTYLRSYKIKAVKGSAKHVKQPHLPVTNHLGTLFVDAVKPDLLLVPTAEDVATTPPAPDAAGHDVDDYKCYLVRISKGTAKLPKGLRVSIVDPFTHAAKAFELRALKHLCVPVDKNAEGIKNALGELACYTVKAAKGEPKHFPQRGLHTNNQFGPLTLDTVHENELCVPSIEAAPSATPTPNGGRTTTPTRSPTSVQSRTPTARPTGIPPDPEILAPPLDHGVTNVPALGTAFLYSGDSPIQTGVVPGAIDLKRAAVIRGRVLATNGDPLPGITVSIWMHPELGQTLTRLNGRFDLAVNGGGPITVDYRKDGLCPVQRRLDVPWQDFVIAPDVVMMATDPAVTNITFGNGAPFQVAESSTQNDGDGARHMLLLFAPGTTASLVMPDGTTQGASSLHIRATEFTVGASGQAAMPAGLPPLSGYTYCVELSADEAMSAGATSVAFNQPVITYAENFLGFPVGATVPVGTYDRTKAAWVPLRNGRVVKVVSISSGLANVDTDGNGTADNGLGITTPERQRLGSVYAAGATLWRVPVVHFSPEDSNWPFATPDDAESPGEDGAGPDPNEPLQRPCQRGGSIVECENQVLGESIPIVGTPFTLDYRSDRVPGKIAKRTIRVSGPSVPASLSSIGLHIAVAGRSFDETFPPAANQQTTFVWDRMDAYGRQVVGGQTLNVTVDYNYAAIYRDPGPFPEAFNQVGGPTLVANPGRAEISISDRFTTVIGEGLTDARTIGLGGWTLDVHHVYDPVARVLHGGNGSRRRAGSLGRQLTTIDLTPHTVLFDVAVGPDGTQYVALPHNDVIVRVALDGTQTVVAGNGIEGFSGDGGPATDAELGDPTGVAVAADGSLYIAEEANRRVRRVAPDGTISTVAGNGTGASTGDEGPATQASLTTAERIAVGTDASLYIVDGGTRIRRVTTDGIIHTVAGTGVVGGAGDQGPATEASLNSASVVVAPDGGFYIADFGNHRVRRVAANGIIDTVADYSADSGRPVYVSLMPDGSLLIAVTFSGAQTPRVDLLKTNGSLVTVAGGGGTSIRDGIPAIQANLVSIRAVAAAPDGSLFIVPGNNGSKLLHVGTALPGFEGKQFLLVSADGGQLYVFDLEGRHLQTLDAMTGAVQFVFGYDASGLLTTVTEKTGEIDNVTTIEHDVSGNPKAIVNPFGQRTELLVDANGFLATIANPAHEETQLASTAAGLLTSLTNPRGKTSTYAYDADGRLVGDDDPVGGSQNLSRVAGDDVVSVTRTTALARATVFQVEDLPAGVQRRTVTDTDGVQRQSTEAIDGATTHTISSDGTSSDLTSGPDPRFGLQAPVQTSTSLTLPSTLKFSTSATRSAVLADPANPLSLVSLTNTNTVGGRTVTTTFTEATRTYVATTPANRTRTRTLDGLGRLVLDHIAGLDAAQLSYDSRGRLASLSVGGGANVRTRSFAYDAHGFLASLTDPLGRTLQYGHDAAGRTTSKTLPDGSTVSMTYDAAGNLTGVTPPGRPSRSFGFSDRNELVTLTPPNVPPTGPTTLTFDLDHALTSIVRPGGRSVTFAHDAAGRLSTRTYATNGVPDGVDTFSYDASGRLAAVGTASGVTTTYSYDGVLVTGEASSGAVVGNVTRTYDGALRLASQSVDGANAIAFGYDADGLLISAGALTISRDQQHGLPTGASLGTLTETIAYNGFGEVTSRAVNAGGTPVYATSITRDGIGRFMQKVETIGGVSDTYAYDYDVMGQLTAVTKNAAPSESYAYDGNRNRTDATAGGATIDADFDGQDRMTRQGTTTFAYSAAGDLQTKTAGAQVTTYAYDSAGALTRVTLPDGTNVDYLVDGRSRRVGKRVDGVLVQGLLYGDALRPVAELDGSNAVVNRFVYTGAHAPTYMIRGGNAFLLITDQVGSVRLVVNAANGATVQRLDYDAFGNVTLDTNPGFQPFAFAGGLYDRDTKLLHFGLRDYDPRTGRWTSPDHVVVAAPNLYAYAENDPVNLVDPFGKNVDPTNLTEGDLAARIAHEFEDATNEEVTVFESPEQAAAARAAAQAEVETAVGELSGRASNRFFAVLQRLLPAGASDLLELAGPIGIGIKVGTDLSSLVQASDCGLGAFDRQLARVLAQDYAGPFILIDGAYDALAFYDYIQSLQAAP